ncbi:SecY subunit domain-containing protein [Chytriomyces sp. MP71]|nr:SecY subunit domain-containing protein [Chytriomyces sp. MP71]
MFMGSKSSSSFGRLRRLNKPAVWATSHESGGQYLSAYAKATRRKPVALGVSTRATVLEWMSMTVPNKESRGGSKFGKLGGKPSLEEKHLTPIVADTPSSPCLSSRHTPLIQMYIRSLKSVVGLLPDIKSPDYKVPFGERGIWTFSAGVVYAVGSQMRLFGANPVASDALFALRPVLGGNRGSIMDLGVLPLVASAFLLQLLAAARIIFVDHDRRDDRAAFGRAQKSLAFLISLILAVISVFGGAYGEVTTPFAAALIVQLVLGSLSVIYLDETLQRGYGFGAGYLIFIAIHISENFFWNQLSFASFKTGRGTEYEGSLISLVQLVLTRKDKFRAVKEAFYRKNLPNIYYGAIQVAVLAAASWLYGYRQEILLSSSKNRAQSLKFPIKLLHTGFYPILIVNSAISVYALLSHLLFNLFPQNLLVRIFGVWKTFDNLPQQYPVKGLAYFLSPPRNVLSSVFDPIQLVVYSVLFIYCVVKLSELWSDAAGSTPKDVSKYLEGQSLVLPGRREGGIYKEVKNMIPEMNKSGAFALAVIALAGDILGPYGCGTASVIVVTVLFQLVEIVAREYQARPPGEELF